MATTSRTQLAAENSGSGQTDVLILPPKRWRWVNLSELWSFRELLYFLTWRDVKVRYKQTVLGAAWAVLQPLLLMVVFTIFLSRLGNVSSEGFPYPIFSYSALVPWTLFASSLNASSISLVGSASLVSKVYFPRLFLPIAAVGSHLVDFLIAFSLLVGMMVYYGITPTIRVLWVPVLALMAMFAAVSIGIWLSALNARYRDVQYAVPFLVQVWLFATPVAYSAGLVKGTWRILYGMNPMAGVVEGFRWALLGTESHPTSLMLASAGAILLILLGGLAYFQRVEQTFADVI